MKHISYNHYMVSDREAARLARASSHGKLPKHGYEIEVTLPDGRLAWLLRTPYRYREDSPKRGWVWAVMPHSDPRRMGLPSSSGDRERRRPRRDPPATRDYEYLVYPEARHSGEPRKAPRGRNHWDLGPAKKIAREMGHPAAIYSVSKGRFVGYIGRSGRFVPFR